MHNYKVGGGSGGAASQKNAKKIRGQAAQADQEAEDEVEQRRGRQKGREQDPGSEQQEPLMEGEVAMSQEGMAPGDIRAYAHRDIKPGK
jgi:serine/threonine kinase 16